VAGVVIRAARRRRGPDIGEYLGLVGPWAWVFLALYTVVFSAIAIVDGIPSAGAPVTLGALVLVLAAAVLIATPAPTPVPMIRLIAIGVLAWGAVVMMLIDLQVHRPDPLASWELGAVNFVFFVLELRGRLVAAWVLMGIVMLTVVIWSVGVTDGPWLGISLTYGQAVSLAAGTIFAIGLQRTARSIFAQQDAERARAGEEAARSAGDAHRSAELAEIRRLAGPLLQRIVAGDTVDPRDAMGLEAALRDRIRGRGLAVEPLTAALGRARERGVDALLLDDLGDAAIASDLALELAAWAAAHVDAARGTHVTVRLAAAPEGAVVSIADADGMVGERLVPLLAGESAGAVVDDPSARRRDRTAPAT
jgi:GNAT superfamily N-acetyltransferase